MHDHDADDSDGLDTVIPPSVVVTDHRDAAFAEENTPVARIRDDGALVDREGRPTPLTELDGSLDGLVLLVADANDAQQHTARQLAALATEQGGGAIWLARTSEPRRRDNLKRSTLVAHVDSVAWSDVVALAVKLLVDIPFGVSLLHRRRSDEALRLRWLRTDVRPAPLEVAVRDAAGGHRIFVGARLPSFAERWHLRGDHVHSSFVDSLVFDGGDAFADVFLVDALPPRHPVEAIVTPEVLPADPRPYDGALALINDLETCARRIASLHLLHGEDGTTRRLFRACVRSSAVTVDDYEEQAARALAEAVNALIGVNVICADD